MRAEGILTMKSVFAGCVVIILGGLAYFTVIGAMHR